MPRNSIQMTQARVKALNPPEMGQSLIYDQEIPNLAVRLSPGGTKTFIVYKKIDGKPRKIGIGRFPGINVEEARRQAKKIIGKLADGIDPVKERKRDEALALTLEKAVEEYKKARESKLRPKTLSEYQRMVDSYLPDWLGKATVDITRDMVEKRHAKITKENGPGAANHCMRALRAILNYVGDKYEGMDGRSILPDNPVRRLTAVRAWNRVERRRTILADSDITQWWKVMDELRDTFPDAADLFTICFLTGMRPGEAARLRISQINLNEKTLEVTDTQNREPLVLPITVFILQLLKMRINGLGEKAEFVFPGTGETGHLVEWKRGANKMRELSGLPSWVVYDLRRTYLTCAEGMGLPPYALKGLVNHKQPNSDVTGGYLLLTPERLRVPAQQVEDKLLSLARVKNLL